MKKIARLIATLFYTGYIPRAQGTIASFLALPFYFLVKDNTALYLSLTVCLLAAGFWSSAAAEKDFTRKDPPEIVIDEFSCFFLALLFVPYSRRALVLGFILFRFFDIVKIPPLKKLQTLPGGWGIMLDDVAAAILANLILQVLRFFPVFI